ncbi:MAG: hypothetical protein ACE3JQ_03935 [Paenisporosarcina sp.]
MSNKIKQEINNIEIPKELGVRSKIGVSKAKSEMTNTKHRWSLVIATAIVAAMALFIFVPNIFTNSHPENPVVITIDSDFVIDTSDPRQVVGISENVFLGKVVKQVGTRNLSSYPETQFEVEVLENIKGELKDTIKVNQAGGYEGNELFLMEGDKQLIEGKTYLLATRYLVEENWHTVVPVGGDIPFNNDEEKKGLIEKYKKAFEEEIPFKF